jgi:DNA-binding NarL/FixJ family response regulator
MFLEALRAFVGTAAVPASADASPLTAAEAAVLELLARGLDNHAIAGQLGKSEKTVRNQVSTIFDKLGVRTRAEAIVHAIGRRIS